MTANIKLMQTRDKPEKRREKHAGRSGRKSDTSSFVFSAKKLHIKTCYQAYLTYPHFHDAIS